MLLSNNIKLPQENKYQKKYVQNSNISYYVISGKESGRHFWNNVFPKTGHQFCFKYGDYTFSSCSSVDFFIENVYKPQIGCPMFFYETLESKQVEKYGVVPYKQQ